MSWAGRARPRPGEVLLALKRIALVPTIDRRRMARNLPWSAMTAGQRHTVLRMIPTNRGGARV